MKEKASDPQSSKYTRAYQGYTLDIPGHWSDRANRIPVAWSSVMPQCVGATRRTSGAGTAESVHREPVSRYELH